MIKERETIEEQRVGKRYRVVHEDIMYAGRYGDYHSTNQYGWIYLRFDGGGKSFFHPEEIEEVASEGENN